jgi:uncharacterized protein
VADAWYEFFLHNNFLTGLSIAGPKEIGDAYQVDKSGKGAFVSVTAATLLLKKHKINF